MSKSIVGTTNQLQFCDLNNPKVTIESDTASSLYFTGDDGSEIAYLKNTTIIPNQVDATTFPYNVPTTTN